MLIHLPFYLVRNIKFNLSKIFYMENNCTINIK